MLIVVQAFFWGDREAGDTDTPEQQQCSPNFCFTVPDQALRQLAGRLETALSKDELSVLRNTCAIPDVADAPPSNYDAHVCGARMHEQPCSTGVAAEMGSAVSPIQSEPVLGPEQAQHEQPDAVQPSTHEPRTITHSSCGPGEEGGAAAQVCGREDASLDIQAWYWGSNSAKQNVPRLPRCAPFRPPYASPRRALPLDPGTSTLPAARRRHGTQLAGPAGNMQGPRMGRAVIGDGKKPQNVSHQGAYRQHSGQKRDHCGSALPGTLQIQETAGGQRRKKKRCGRFVRELEESAAAERDNKVELGFNANLKQFEKSQRDKGVFQNRRKRATVYTVSGGLAE